VNKGPQYCDQDVLDLHNATHTLLAEKDTEISTLKDLISGRKGIEELYKLQQLAQEQGQEIRRLRKEIALMRTEVSEAYVPDYLSAKIERIADRALSHQTEQPDTTQPERTYPQRVELVSDYTPLDDPNKLLLIRDAQGDVHISTFISHDDERGVRIAASGTRFNHEVRKAFYTLIDALQAAQPAPKVEQPDTQPGPSKSSMGLMLKDDPQPKLNKYRVAYVIHNYDDGINIIGTKQSAIVYSSNSDDAEKEVIEAIQKANRSKSVTSLGVTLLPSEGRG
jgi:hypothetical protein